MIHFKHQPVINNGQWRKLAASSGLPDRVREEIEDIISIYCALRAYPADYPKLRKQLQRAKKSEVESLKWLNKTVVTQTFFSSIAAGLDWEVPLSLEGQASNRERISRAVKEKEWLIEFYDMAIQRLYTPRSRGAKKQQSLRFLVTYLLVILVQSAGRPFTGSKMNIRSIWDICHIADSNLRYSTVQEIVKEIVHEERTWDNIPKQRIMTRVSPVKGEIPILIIPVTFPLRPLIGEAPAPGG